MAIKSGYKKEHAFPNESFIQEAIDTYFISAGYIILDDKYTDLVCKHPINGDTWYIEAKGLTSQVGLDFRTCIGQLVQRMKVQSSFYAIALPNIEKFREQALLVAPYVRESLNLHWIFVHENQSLTVLSPSQTLDGKLHNP
ncbi:hypothetical protein F0261_17915 [Alteromonas sp. 07-89-2]|uniref:hypothetical protein n=1 Tax=unclassified Alteromonas TaxID=2614992 RepID=UPI00148B7DE8|nr:MULTISPECIES: hypothetical protein [unclassified Alteromonas]MCG7639684.1 hypothetical protein [Alteromonas sp. CNT1-28]MCG7811624.1 hypothetical protein [Alteromonas sp. MCA-1]NOH59905.1 hypothetical protein [Alteromonas sp. 07-89-2]